MKAYQLTVLCLAFFGQSALAAPTPQDAETEESNVRYMSKYPQHPLNQGSSDDYPKYWLGEGPLGPLFSGVNKAAMPPPPFSPQMAYAPQAGYQAQAASAPMYGQTSDAYNQPRQLFVPYPYSESWNSIPNPAPVKPEPEIPTYSPPRGFPTERGSAKAAIAHYSALKAAEEAAAAGEAPPAAPKAESVEKGDLALVKNEDGSKTLGFGSEFSGYQKAPSANPVPQEQIGVMPDNWSEVSYSYTDVRKNLEDIPVIREAALPNPYLNSEARKRRKNAALEKLEGFLAPEEQTEWHLVKRDAPAAPAKAPVSGVPAPASVAAAAAAPSAPAANKPKVVEGVAFAKEAEWPDHIKTKAQKMMEQAELMQRKGTKMAADDPRNKKLAEEKKEGDDDKEPPKEINPDDSGSDSDNDNDDIADQNGGRPADEDDPFGADSGSDSDDDQEMAEVTIVKKPAGRRPGQQPQQRPVQMQVKKAPAPKGKSAPAKYVDADEDTTNVYPAPVRKSASQFPQRRKKVQAPVRNPYIDSEENAFLPPPPPPQGRYKKAAPAVPGPNKKQQEIPLPLPPLPKSKEDLDPLMRGELPDRSGKTKTPKKPKSARTRQVSDPPIVAPKTTKEKARKQNDNMPSQTQGRPRLQNIKRDVELEPELEESHVELVDDVAQEHLAQFMLKRPDRMKKIEKIDAKKAPLVGGSKKAQSPHQGSKNSGPGITNNGSRGPLSSTSGRNRPSLNQDRPGKKKDRKKATAHEKREEHDYEPVRTPRKIYPVHKLRPDGDRHWSHGKNPVELPPYFGGPVPSIWVLTHTEREQKAAEIAASQKPVVTFAPSLFEKRDANPAADPDPRRVLPAGPPVTIRRVLGPNDPLPTKLAASAPVVHHHVEAPVVHHHVEHHDVASPPSVIHQIADGQIQAGSQLPAHIDSPAEHFGPGDLIQQIPDGQVQAQQEAIAQQQENASRIAQGLPPIDFVVPVWPPAGIPASPPNVIAPAVVSVTGPTVTVHVPGPVQYIEGPARVIEKIVTRVETVQAPAIVHCETQYQIHTQTVHAAPQVHRETVQVQVPVRHDHTVVQSIPYKVDHTIYHSVPYKVVQTETVVNYARETVVQQQKVPVTKVQSLVKTQVQTVQNYQTVGVPVAVPVVSEHTQTIVNSVPVRVTITPAAVTKLATMVVSSPGKTKIKTVEAAATQTVVQTAAAQTVYATVNTTVEVPAPTKTVERVVVPKPSQVAIGDTIRESIKEIVEEVETTEYVPVVKTVYICPVCEQTEEECGCGTNFAVSGNTGSGGMGFPGEVNCMEQVEGIEDGVHQEVAEAVGYMSSLAGIPRDPAAIEAFVRGRIPGGGYA